MNCVEINVDDSLWEGTPNYKDWQSALSEFWNCTVKKRYTGNKCFSLTVLLTNDDCTQKLNREFRGKNAPTNVLSFPQYPSGDICRIDTIEKKKDIYVGDIAMSYDQIMRESAQFHLEFFNRCSHLFVHGGLHLLGMDHINQVDRDNMENLEIEILEEFGIKNPYIIEGDL